MKNLEILYAEDEQSTIQFVKLLFKKNNINNVTFVKNGLEALEIYKQKKFDLVITDIIMPELNGFELIESIREINSNQLFMMVTGLENRDDLIYAIELKVQYFVEKPIQPKKFVEILNECIQVIQDKRDARLSNLLLSQYEHAIDSTTILLKTDANGIITYVNSSFNNITQYSNDECIGKTYDLIYNSNTDNGLFEEIRTTLKSKKEWKGIIKSRTKDGSEYIIDSLILPLLDSDNEVIEYLSIGHDITKSEQLKNSLKEQLDIAVEDIVDTQKEVVFTMGAIGETRSKETGFHVKRVAEYSYTLAKLVGLDEESSQLLKLASPMHDIGKVGIPDAILNKPGKLDFDEFEIMKTHATLGYEMLKGSNRDILKTSAIVALEHHEKWDGTGYPKGLKADEIHIYGRITAICDVFDALGSDRCYKKGWELEKIYAHFREQRGKQFDPNLIDLFFDNIDAFLEIRSLYVDV